MSETMSDLSAGPAVEGLADGSERDAVLTVARQARAASTVLGPATRGDKDAAIRAMADALDARAVEVIAANQADVERAVGSGTAAGLVDRLTLTPERLASIADALRDVAELPDPVGEVVRGYTLPNGLEVRQMRVPLGVIGIIYEARPNVTVDAASLCLKAGNAVLLRGSSSAYASNT
ncbi:MAG: gamma-glutamyl-phosphate reductase, partial [Actinomycetes bacterium]